MSEIPVLSYTQALIKIKVNADDMKDIILIKKLYSSINFPPVSRRNIRFVAINYSHAKVCIFFGLFWDTFIRE